MQRPRSRSQLLQHAIPPTGIRDIVVADVIENTFRAKQRAVAEACIQRARNAKYGKCLCACIDKSLCRAVRCGRSHAAQPQRRAIGERRQAFGLHITCGERRGFRCQRHDNASRADGRRRVQAAAGFSSCR